MFESGKMPLNKQGISTKQPNIINLTKYVL